MAEQVGGIDYERLKRAMGRANTAQYIRLDMTNPNVFTLLATGGLTIRIIDKSTAAFTLTVVFFDGSSIDMDNTDVTNGNVFNWDFYQLLITSPAQPGITIRIIVDYRNIIGVGGL